MESRTHSSISQLICIAKLQSDEFNELIFAQIFRRKCKARKSFKYFRRPFFNLHCNICSMLQHSVQNSAEFSGLKETDQPPSSLAFPGKRITDIRDGEIIPVTCTLPNFTQTLLPLIIKCTYYTLHRVIENLKMASKRP